MLDGAFILLAPIAVAFIAYRITKGLQLSIAALWAVLAIYALWAADLLFFPLMIDPRLREQALIEATHYAWWINVVPFTTVYGQLTAPTGIAIRQLGGNLGLLSPLGLLGPVVASKLRTWTGVLRVALTASIGIELLQMFGTLTGLIRRSVDIDDVIVNVMGAALGFAIWKVMRLVARRTAPKARPASIEVDPA